MWGNYLIPANTKRGRLIFGWFRPFDLALFGSGILVTLVLLAFVPIPNAWMLILILAPAVITGFLVMPVPYYHNMLNIIVELYEFLFVNPREYEWTGWCYKKIGRAHV